MHTLFALGLLLASHAALASPCDAVNRDLPRTQAAQWAGAIAKQLEVPSVKVLQTFALRGWNIVYVETPNSDPPFVFFHGAPDTVHYVALWSGGAGADEEASIREWTIQSAPGIPADLAKCFAWHVTKARDL